MDPLQEKPGSRTHAFNVDDLIVHNYSERDALLKKADQLARALIEEQLREGEAYRSPEPGSFILLFPKLTPEAGALRAAVITDQISREVRKLNPTSMALERRREDEAAPLRVNARMPSGSVDSPKALASRALARMADSKSGKSQEAGLTLEDRAALAKLQVMFHPVWHAKNQHITAYQCVLRLENGDVAHKRHILEILAPYGEDLALAKADQVICGHAVEALQFLAAEKIKAILIQPVHFSTVDRLHHIAPLLEMLGQLPEEARNLLVIELIDIPGEMTRFRLREPLAYLKTRARALIARPGFVPRDFELFKENNFHGVSVDLRSYDWPEKRLLQSFELFVSLAEKHKLQSFVLGVDTTSLAVAATTSGFAYIEGKAISEAVDHPARIQPFENDMLFEE